MLNYLVAAYAVLWIILLVYVFTLSGKCRRLTNELRQLKQEVTDKTK